MSDDGETGASMPPGPATSGDPGVGDTPAQPSAAAPEPSAPISLQKASRSEAAAAGPVTPAVDPAAPPAVDPPAVDPAAPPAVDPTATSDPAPTRPVAVPAPTETRSQRRKREKAEKPRRKAPWWELPALVALAIGIAILVKTFVVQPFYIPSESMEKTLHGCTGCHGDRILVNKPIYDLRDPHAGDIVVFHDPKQWESQEPISRPPNNPVVRTIRGFGQLVGFVPPDGQVLVKRVIATGGQTVKGDAQGHVMISTTGQNGTFRTLKEPYVYVPASDTRSQMAFGPVTVPKGRLWVMGDHRNNSADSRFHCTSGQESTSNDTDCDPTSSTVPVDDVIGKAFVIAWPPSRWRTLGTPSTFESAAMACAPALPGAVSMATVLPVFVVRRRRRSAR